MSWAQHDKTLQETIAFSDKTKNLFSYSDPGGTLEKKTEQPKALNLKKRITFQKRSKKML